MDKKHTCDFCNKTYASASSKSTHIKKFHKNTEEKEISVEKVIEEIPIEKEIPVEKKKVQKNKIKVEEKVKPVEKVIEEISIETLNLMYTNEPYDTDCQLIKKIDDVNEIPVEEKKKQKKKIKVEEKVQPLEEKIEPVEEKKIKIKKSKKIIPKFEQCDDCEECFDNREELFFHIVRNHKTEDIYKVFNSVSSDPDITEEDQELIDTVGELNEILNEISETAINYKKKVEENLKKDLKEDPETTKELIYEHIKKKYGNKITEIMDESYTIIKQIARNFYQRKLDDFVNGGLIYNL
jgi:hypothetical protein